MLDNLLDVFGGDSQKQPETQKQINTQQPTNYLDDLLGGGFSQPVPQVVAPQQQNNLP